MNKPRVSVEVTAITKRGPTLHLAANKRFLALVDSSHMPLKNPPLPERGAAVFALVRPSLLVDVLDVGAEVAALAEGGVAVGAGVGADVEMHC